MSTYVYHFSQFLLILFFYLYLIKLCSLKKSNIRFFFIYINILAYFCLFVLYFLLINLLLIFFILQKYFIIPIYYFIIFSFQKNVFFLIYRDRKLCLWKIQKFQFQNFSTGSLGVAIRVALDLPYAFSRLLELLLVQFVYIIMVKYIYINIGINFLYFFLIYIFIVYYFIYIIKLNIFIDIFTNKIIFYFYHIKTKFILKKIYIFEEQNKFNLNNKKFKK